MDRTAAAQVYIVDCLGKNERPLSKTDLFISLRRDGILTFDCAEDRSNVADSPSGKALKRVMLESLSHGADLNGEYQSVIRYAVQNRTDCSRPSN